MIAILKVLKSAMPVFGDFGKKLTTLVVVPSLVAVLSILSSACVQLRDRLTPSMGDSQNDTATSPTDAPDSPNPTPIQEMGKAVPKR